MAEKTKNNGYVQWYIYFIYACLFSFVGGMAYYHESYFLAYVLLFVSCIYDILALKSLITEAHIKALEIFYGKERAIKD